VTKWKAFVCPLLLACLALPGSPAIAGATEDKPAVRVYTNEDLDRVRPLRDETGVASVPAFPPDGKAGRSPGSDAAGLPAESRGTGRRSEAYWRAEAERVRERLRKLKDQAEDLGRRIATVRPDPWSSSRRRRTAPDTSAWQARLAELEGRRREIEGDFLDRARRDGALPGWLR
jgi:hypothetical protein